MGAPRPAHWPVTVDELTGSAVALSYAHHEIHAGSSFVTGAKSTPASGAALELAFKVGAAKTAHMVVRWETQAQATLELIEGASWTTNTGTLAPIHCRNRESPGTSTIEEDKTATPAFAPSGNVLVDPTAVTGGTVLKTQTTWSTRNAGGGGDRGLREFVLKKGELYVVRLTNDDAAARGVELELDWYEETQS